jgi:hypothetical protein
MQTSPEALKAQAFVVGAADAAAHFDTIRGAGRAAARRAASRTLEPSSLACPTATSTCLQTTACAIHSTIIANCAISARW